MSPPNAASPSPGCTNSSPATRPRATLPSNPGSDAIKWHLEHHHSTVVSRATISRYLTRHGLVPEPKKQPKSSYIRFQVSTDGGISLWAVS